ncbi:response regulator [Qipengyuania flava]|nr:response regulator [Qipengyuania flava]
MKVCKVPRIVIVEADRALAFMMAESFTSAGFKVVGCARNARDAIELVQQHKPDMLILEFDLEGQMNGLELVAQIKLRHPSTRTILVTGWDINDIAARIEGVHPDRIVRKPFMPQKLIQVIEHAHHRASPLPAVAATLPPPPPSFHMH